jgi:rare lipoprotein A
VDVLINDRLHPKMKRVVDLTKSAAKKLGYIDHGLTKVKVEVIEEVKKKKKKN